MVPRQSLDGGETNEEARCYYAGTARRRRPQPGPVAIAEFDLVATLVGLEFGQTNGWSRIIYGLVGLSPCTRPRGYQ